MKTREQLQKIYGKEISKLRKDFEYSVLSMIEKLKKANVNISFAHLTLVEMGEAEDITLYDKILTALGYNTELDVQFKQWENGDFKE